MPTPLRLCFLVLLALGGSGCLTTLPVNLYQPPVVALPAQVDTLVLVSPYVQAGQESPPQPRRDDRLDRNRETELPDTTGYARAVGSFAAMLVQNGGMYTVVDSQPLRLPLTPRGLAGFPWERLRQKAGAAGAGLLVYVHQFDNKAEVIRPSASQKANLGYGDFPAFVRLKAVTHLVTTVYDPYREQVLDHDTLTEELYWDGPGFSLSQALGELPQRNLALADAALYAGESVATRLIPLYFPTERALYPSGSAEMKQAFELAKQGDWQRAARLWQPLAVDPENGRLAGKAAYNLAVASEALGLPKVAYTWAKKAFVDYGIRPAGDYLKILPRPK